MLLEVHAILAAAPTGVWATLLDILVLLSTAVVLGTVAERLGQSVIVGYLLAGTLVGPNVLGWIATERELFGLAELGVALLLFAIGLEFSPRRLLALGGTALKIGVLQTVLTTAAGFAAASLWGLAPREAMVVGMMVAVSSTACVMRLLADRRAIDSEHGRMALGVLLVQDAAVIPMMILVSVMATGGSGWMITGKLALALALAAVLIGVFYVLFQVIAPRLLRMPTWRKNRDLPILLAVIMATGAAWVTHALGLSAAAGAFAAGVLLAVSPFATQVRADVRPLTTLMVALFFGAIGMFGDPIWLVEHWLIVASIVLLIIVGKPLLLAVVAIALGRPVRYGIATALCLAQAGEFSFVLATIAQRDTGGAVLMSSFTFRAMVAATIVTLLLTPYLVAVAPWTGRRVERWLRSSTGARGAATSDREDAEEALSSTSDLILIIGFGPAGQRVAEGLLESQHDHLAAVDLSPGRLDIARRYGLAVQVGDATHRDIMEHAGVHRARAVVITVPDHATTHHLIHLVRDLAPDALIIARCRYHVMRWELLLAGAHQVVDEEDQVGRRLAAQVRQLVGRSEDEPR